MNPIRRALRWLAKNRPESRRWLDTPCGCCSCGTGGPYYEGDAPQVTRYVYVDACGESDGTPDWSSCSTHPLEGVTPIVDYGRDVVVTFRQTEADTATILAGGQLQMSLKTHAPAGMSRTWTNEEMRTELKDIAARARRASAELKD
jgi:hypothetical protein